jgi:hypothetical protein
MTSADPVAGFSLTYELQLDDLLDLFAASAERKRRRGRLIFSALVYLLIGAAFTAVMVELDRLSVVRNSSGAPSWMYVVDAVIWLGVALCAVTVWRLSPKRLARRTWRASLQLHGRHRDEVGSGGVTTIQPDGTQTSIPWANFGSIRETEKVFELLDHRSATWVILPKRGLPRPDLIPALREFLHRSVNGRPSPAAVPDAGAESKRRRSKADARR